MKKLELIASAHLLSKFSRSLLNSTSRLQGTGQGSSSLWWQLWIQIRLDFCKICYSQLVDPYYEIYTLHSFRNLGVGTGSRVAQILRTEKSVCNSSRISSTTMFCNSGSQGWGYATDAALNPVVYSSNAAVGMRFAPLAPSTIARMYHSTANLLPVSV